MGLAAAGVCSRVLLHARLTTSGAADMYENPRLLLLVRLLPISILSTALREQHQLPANCDGTVPSLCCAVVPPACCAAGCLHALVCRQV